MSSRKKRSKDRRLSQLSPWQWNSAPYQQELLDVTSQAVGVGSNSDSSDDEIEYNQLENKGAERTNLEGVSSTYQMTELGENQQRSTQELVPGKYAVGEKLDPAYRVHSSNQFKFFKVGRVFKVLWSEPIGSGGTEITTTTMVRSETTFQRVRRFVIIGSAEGHSKCLPILAYGGEGFHKTGVTPEGIVYSSNKGSKIENHGTIFGRAIKRGPVHYGIPSRISNAKINTVEHNVKVFFIGQVDQRNMKRLQSGDTGWMRADTGEDIPIIMEEQPCPSFDCYGNRFQFPCRCVASSKMIPWVGLPLGLLMSSSYLWLNEKMELCKPSATLEMVIDYIPKSILEAILGIPNWILFAFFLVGTAGLTGATIASVTHCNTSANMFAFQLLLALAGLIASGMVGFSVEEIVLVCLPTIIGCSILSSGVVEHKQVGHVQQDEKVLWREVRGDTCV